MGQRVYNFDAELEFKDAGLVAASAAAEVDSSAKIVDVGTGRWEGVMVIDVSAIEIASNDEEYYVIVQGSSSATFASDIQNLAMLDFAATEVRHGSGIDSTTGRYELAFCNEQDDVRYRYLRVWTHIEGTIAGGGGINYKAFAAPVRWG